MARYVFTIYEPPTPGFPWLAVTLDGNRPVDTFACPSLRAADRVLDAMHFHWTMKDRQDRRRTGRESHVANTRPAWTGGEGDGEKRG
jgi:hypothetical protein